MNSGPHGRLAPDASDLLADERQGLARKALFEGRIDLAAGHVPRAEGPASSREVGQPLRRER